ncbi:acetolactate synthase large subunit [Micromonospora sp. NPDC050397]|uniref:acetolactate synthase large subunit n=1 Tax=Micromonospora sp. NPDC050397 TaxID=3364279 RepID=UPI003850EDD9
MNGAEALMRTLAGSGVEVCFANPGTTELHLVRALDAVPQVRPVLGLFEGVVTGAADGYARMAGKPAATLLHLGPGLGHGMANLHNTRRANSPLVNIVGDHPTRHKAQDPPLESDIAAVAGTLRGPVRRPENPTGAGQDGASAYAEALEPPGQIATLVMPADVSWGEGGTVADPMPARSVPPVDPAVIQRVCTILRGDEPAVLIIGGPAGREPGLRAAGRIAASTGVRVMLEQYVPRLEHGAGVPTFEQLAAYPEQVASQLDGVRQVIVAGGKAPVSFFAYPEQPSCLVPPEARTQILAEVGQDVVGALTALADLLDPDSEPELSTSSRPALPTGALTATSWAQVIGALLPERAIVVDETMSCRPALAGATAGAPRHDLLVQLGGAMGEGMPMAIGAAIAAPDRPVITLEGDGCAVYTISALWTQAREKLNITNVILTNRSYAILREEWGHLVAGGVDARSDRLFDLGDPTIDYVSIAEGFGVPGSRATTAEELAEQFSRAVAEPGPHLIEAIFPPVA